MSVVVNEADDALGAKCLEYIDLAFLSMCETIKYRKKKKLSYQRFRVIAQELAELKKVLACYSESWELTDF